MWTIAFYGTNTYKTVNSDSLISFANFGVTDPMTDNSWLKYDVIGMSPKRDFMSEPDEYTGGITVHRGKQKRSFEIHFDDFIFPDDMKKLEDLFALLSYRYIYLFKGDYDFQANNYSIHPDNYVMLIACSGQVEDDYDNGLKRLVLNCKKVRPIP